MKAATWRRERLSWRRKREICEFERRRSNRIRALALRGALAIILVLVLALPARAEGPAEYFQEYSAGHVGQEAAHPADTTKESAGAEAGIIRATPAPDGRSVELRSGQPAPFDGALVDDAYSLIIRNRRRAAELAADKALQLVVEKDADLVACQAGGGSGWKPATVAAFVATALAVGVVGGVWLGATAAR